MAIAAWIIWRTPRRRTRSKYYSTYSNDDSQGAARQDALTVFYIQLGLGLLWTEMFFHFHRFLVSSVVILALWLRPALHHLPLLASPSHSCVAAGSLHRLRSPTRPP